MLRTLSSRKISQIVASDDRRAPSEIVVFPTGTVETTKYDPFTVDAESAQRCIAAFRALGRDLVIDYEHQTLGGEYSSPDGKARAAGWITQLRWDESRGLVASVRWTRTAEREIVEDEYRYFSPVGDVEEGKFVELAHVGLTNDPATRDIAPLVAASRRACRNGAPQMDLQALLSMLGLPEDATKEDIKAALNDENIVGVADHLGTEASVEAIAAKIDEALAGDVTAKDDDDHEGMGALSRLAGELGISDEFDGVDGLVSLINGRKTSNDDDDADSEVAVLRRTVAQQDNRIKQLEASNQRTEFDTLLSGKYAGRVKPAQREEFFGLFKRDRKAFDLALSNMVPIATNGSSITGDGNPADTDEGSEYERKIVELKKTGMNAEQARREAAQQCPESYDAYRTSRRFASRPRESV